MRITDSFNKLSIDQVKAATSPAAVSPSQSTTQAAVQVTVSPQARALASAQAPSDIDEAKVARLKSAVDSGSLHVDSAKIASRIVEGD